MEKEKTAFLIVDMQNEVVEKLGAEGKKIIPFLYKALSFFRKKKIPVIYLLREHRKDGSDIEKFRLKGFLERPFMIEETKGVQVIPELTPEQEDYLIIKKRFSGFFQTDLLMLLTRLKIEHLVIAGLQTPNCVRCTVTDAIGYDFSVTVLQDATAAKTKEIHEANLLDMENMGVTILNTEEFCKI